MLVVVMGRGGMARHRHSDNVMLDAHHADHGCHHRPGVHTETFVANGMLHGYVYVSQHRCHQW